MGQNRRLQVMMSVTYPHLVRIVQICQSPSHFVPLIPALLAEHLSVSRDTKTLELRRPVQQRIWKRILHQMSTGAALDMVEYRWLTSDQPSVRVFWHRGIKSIKNIPRPRLTELGNYLQKLAKHLRNLTLMKSPLAEETFSQALISKSFPRCTRKCRGIITTTRQL